MYIKKYCMLQILKKIIIINVELKTKLDEMLIKAKLACQ